MKSKLFSFLICLLIPLSGLWGHGVQLRWNIEPNSGAIRVWIEHWHGQATNVANFPLNVSYTVGGVTTTQTYYATGYVNGSTVANLPNGGNTSTLLSSCPGNANAYNNWVYWDFNPPACNTPVSLTIIAGPAVETTEACSQLYPQTINSNFNDNTGPALTCNNITVPPSGANCDAVVSSYGVTAVDACGGATSVSYSIAEGSAFALGSTAVTATASDQYGNTSTCTFNVIVADNQAPTVVTQNTSVILVNGSAGITAADVDGGSYDGNTCGGIASVTVSPNQFGCSNLGQNTVTLTVTDLSGNVSTGTAIVTVTDTVKPTISGPGNISVNAATGRCFAEVNYSVIASLYSCGITQDLSSSPVSGLASGASFPLGTTTNTFSVTDMFGQTATYSFDVTVVQNNPVTVDAGNDIDLCIGSSTNLNAVLSNLPAGSSASSGNSQTTVCIYDANGGNCTFPYNDLCSDGYTFETGSRSGSATVAGSLNSISYKMYYTSCDYNKTLTLRLNGQIIGTRSAAYTCTCSPAYNGDYPYTMTFSASQVAGVWNANGTNTFTVDADGIYVAGYSVIVDYSTSSFRWVDASNISDSTDQNAAVSPTTTTTYYAEYVTDEGCITTDSVTVNVLSLPTVSLATYPAVSFYAPLVTLTGGQPAGGTYSGLAVGNGTFDPGQAGIGTHNITYTYTDGNGCTASATATIEVIPCNIQLSGTVADVTCPNGTDGAIDLTAINTNGTVTYVWTGTGGFTASTEDISGVPAGTYSVTVTDGDGCSESTTFNVVDIPDNTPPTAVAQNVTVQLDASGNGSTNATAVNNGSSDYCGIAGLSLSQTSFDCSHVGNNTVVLTVTDVNGNVSTANANVIVVDNIAPTAIAQNVTVQLDASGNTSTSAAAIDNGSFDNCGIAGLSLSQTSFDCSHVGNNTVVLTVTDVNGNISTANATVNVVDNIAPTAIAQNVTVQLDANGNASTSAVAIDNGSFDNCGIAGLSLSQTSFDCSHVGNNTVVLTVTDVNGNVSAANATVNVVDNIAPTALAQNVTVQLDANGNASTSAVAIDNGSFDNCGIAGLSLSQTSFDCSHVGNNAVALTVTDVNGNVSTANAIVTVVDNIVPTAIAQNITIQLDATGNAAIVAGDVDNGSFDNCGIAGLTLDITAFSCADIGANPVVLTVTDVNGNISTASAVITVMDDIAPVIASCPSDVEYCGPQAISWTPPTATDACLVSFTSNFNPGDFFAAGSYVVSYTATDGGGNTTNCSFEIVVHELPALSISQADVPEFCQGLGVLTVDVANEANLLAPVSYTWSGGLGNGSSATIMANGTYTVTVSDARGCSNVASYTVNVDPSTVLGGYVILSDKEVHIHESTVSGGGIGVINPGKKAKIHKNSTIHTFVTAPQIEIKHGSTVGQANYSFATVSLPVFLYGNHGNTNVKVNKNQTMTISGTSYKKIEVKKGATLIVNSTSLEAEELKIEDDATIIFNHDAIVMVEKKVDAKKDVTINPGQKKVDFYVEDHFHIHEGSTFTGNVYSLKHLHVHGKKNSSTYMNGQFIALDKVHSHENVHWNWVNLCDPNAPVQSSSKRNINIASTDEEVVTTGPEMSLSVYPNPAEAITTIELEMTEAAEVNILLIGIQGKTMYQRSIMVEKGINQYEIDLTQYAKGVYMVRIQSGEKVQTERLIKE